MTAAAEEVVQWIHHHQHHPGKSTLVAPANNKTCETGTSVSDTQSTVLLLGTLQPVPTLMMLESLILIQVLLQTKTECLQQVLQLHLIKVYHIHGK